MTPALAAKAISRSAPAVKAIVLSPRAVTSASTLTSSAATAVMFPPAVTAASMSTTLSALSVTAPGMSTVPVRVMSVAPAAPAPLSTVRLVRSETLSSVTLPVPASSARSKPPDSALAPALANRMLPSPPPVSIVTSAPRTTLVASLKSTC